MNEQITINNKWIEASTASFEETFDESTGTKKLYLNACIVPFNQKSRNGVMYNKKSIEETYHMLKGKTLNHNHVTNGETVYPRGKWIDTWLEDDGMYGKAEVFQTDYNKDYISWLKADNEPRVSLQVTGGAKSIKEKLSGKYYKEATINEWLETSTVVVPGFDSAKANFEVALAEAFDSQSLEESITPGKYKTKGGETITVHKVSDGKATISGDDSKNKEIDVDALKAIIVKEDLQESAMKDVQDFIDELSNKGTSEKDIIKAVIKKYRLKKDEVDNLMDENKEFFEKLFIIRNLNP